MDFMVKYTFVKYSVCMYVSEHLDSAFQEPHKRAVTRHFRSFLLNGPF